MSLRRQIATRLVTICLEDGLFVHQPERLDIDEIGDRDLRDSAWFDSMSLMFLQAEIESEWGVHIASTELAAWLRTLNQIADYIAERLPPPGGSPTSGLAEPRRLSSANGESY